MTPPVLETARLRLRRFEDADADAALVLDLDSDPEVMRFIGPHRFPDVPAYRERIRTAWLPHYTRPHRGCLAVEEKATGDFLGWVMLRPATGHRFAAEIGWTRDSDFELGYRLRRAAWGRGVATEAAAELVRLGLADPDVTCVVACALVPNRASTRVMEKVGLAFARETSLPGYDDALALYALCRAGSSPP